MGRFNDYDRSSPIPMWEQAILKGGIGLDEFTEEDVVKLVCILETTKDEEKLKVARLLLLYKRDPSALYITNNHWEAVDILEELFQLPIRRPWMWFEEEK